MAPTRHRWSPRNSTKGTRPTPPDGLALPIGLPLVLPRRPVSWPAGSTPPGRASPAAGAHICRILNGAASSNRLGVRGPPSPVRRSKGLPVREAYPAQAGFSLARSRQEANTNARCCPVRRAAARSPSIQQARYLVSWRRGKTRGENYDQVNCCCWLRRSRRNFGAGDYTGSGSAGRRRGHANRLWMRPV
jgi:hypothetical protein